MEVALSDFLQVPAYALLIMLLIELRRLERRIARLEGFLMRNGYCPDE